MAVSPRLSEDGGSPWQQADYLSKPILVVSHDSLRFEAAAAALSLPA